MAGAVFTFTRRPRLSMKLWCWHTRLSGSIPFQGTRNCKLFLNNFAYHNDVCIFAHDKNKIV